MLRVTATNLPTLSLSAVDQAAEFLGITEPIHIQGKKAVKRTYAGSYNGLLWKPVGGCRYFPKPRAEWSEMEAEYARLGQKPVERRHVILLGSWGFNCRTLWHELAHAAQCEKWHAKDHNDFFRKYNDDLRERNAYSRRTSAAVTARYRENPWEKDAIEHELLADDHPLFPRPRNFAVATDPAIHEFKLAVTMDSDDAHRFSHIITRDPSAVVAITGLGA